MLKKLLPLLVLSLAVPPMIFAGSEDVPKEKHGRFSVGGAMRGSGFRMTVIHPMRGDFSEYDTLEIVKMTSDVGDRISDAEMQKYADALVGMFQKDGMFKEVVKVDEPRLAGTSLGAGKTLGQGSEPTLLAFLSDPSGGPSGTIISIGSDSNGRAVPQRGSGGEASVTPQSDAFAAVLAPQSKHTMVITSEMIYYLKGSRGARAIGLGGGRSRYVVRFHVYDKERNLELAMGNVAGEVMDSFLAVPFLGGDGDAREAAATAIVNRVEIRKAKADQ